MTPPRRIGFLSFGAWHPAGGLTHSGGDALRQTVELAVAAEEIGIDGAFVRVQGSVVIASSPEEPRACHLLPEVHVSLLREDAIVADLSSLFAALGGRPPSALAIVTGPSRSADIEQRLVVGVHGPREVHVVLE